MTRVGFKEAFMRGLGSAFIELKNCESRGKYKDIVLWCCLHNTCYDMQSEGGRGVYLYNSINLYEDKSFFEEAIIRQFMKKKYDIWLFDQLCELLVQFSEDGSTKSRNALYTKYDELFAVLSNKQDKCDERDAFEWLCVWLTSLDGFQAFKRIAEQLGELFIITKGTNILNFDWFYSNACNKFGKKRVENYLRNSAVKSKAIEAFLNEVICPERHSSQFINSPSLEELVEACREPKGYISRGIALHFARSASEENLIKLAQIALKETNPDIKLGLLWAFRKVRFPLDEHYIFEFAESDNECIRDIAFSMLEQLPSEKIHGYSISLIKQKREMVNALSLLCHCYMPQDEAILIEGIRSLSVSYGDGGWHGVFMDAENLLNNKLNKLDPSLFVYLYHKTLCSACRSRLIQSMFRRKILPREILEECLYDSNESTRKFAERKLIK